MAEAAENMARLSEAQVRMDNALWRTWPKYRCRGQSDMLAMKKEAAEREKRLDECIGQARRRHRRG